MTGYDLLIRNGIVPDPLTGHLVVRDLAVSGGKVVLLSTGISPEGSANVVDASGRYVLPGLVDLHTHVFRGCTFWGIDHRLRSGATGVTTWIDAGSSGAFSFGGFRELVIDSSAERVRAFLNVSVIGLIAETHESERLENCDVGAALRVIEINRDMIVGVKVRIDHDAVGNNMLRPLVRAVQIASEFELPIMVHIGDGPPYIDDLLREMRPGDILTHCFAPTDMSLVDDQGLVRDSAREATSRGVLLDLGHGAGGFSFRIAERMLEANIGPDIVSSDTHALSVNGPMVDLPTCMNKMLALGVDLADVVRAVTKTPAETIGLGAEVGSLQAGRDADIAIFALDEGEFEFFDVEGERRTGKLRLRNIATFMRGSQLSNTAVGD